MREKETRMSDRVLLAILAAILGVAGTAVGYSMLAKDEAKAACARVDVAEVRIQSVTTSVGEIKSDIGEIKRDIKALLQR
jgi:ABC-type proline/glycine betaine transport system substrate-binding protein